MALNSTRNGLLGLLIASNFVEIKSNVFKRWDVERIRTLVRAGPGPAQRGRGEDILTKVGGGRTRAIVGASAREARVWGEAPLHPKLLLTQLPPLSSSSVHTFIPRRCGWMWWSASSCYASSPSW